MSAWDEPLDDETAAAIAGDPAGMLNKMWGVPFAAAKAAIAAGRLMESNEIERLRDRQDETRWRDPAAEQPAPWSLVLVAEQCAPEHKGSAREVTIGEQDPDGTWWDLQECRLFVTHWRPLPAPPEATA